MKINYKIATIVLSAILLITYTWHWEDIFFHNKSEMKMDNKMSSMGGMHQMPNGEMMMNNGNSMMDMTMTDMVKMMDGKTGKTLEKEFITGMIPHHQGAVDMANKLLADPTVSQTLKDFAKQIISAQEGEIKMMNEWLKKY
jgi:uncharacterized protein (DUF305 family)